MRLRPLTPADHPACLALFDGHVGGAFHAGERAGFERWLRTAPGPAVVVEEAGGRILACGGVAPEEAPGLYTLCWGIVHAGHQGEGLGHLLLLARLVEAARAGADIVRLETVPATAGFFRRVGFETVAVRHDPDVPGGRLHEMRVALDPTRVDRWARTVEAFVAPPPVP